jgi:hypothetical protein
MILVGRPERQRLLERLRHGGENNTKMTLQKIGWGAWTGFMWLTMEISVGHL